MMYVALPVQSGNAIIGVVRTSIPVTSIEDTMAEIYRRIALGGVVIALLAAVLSLWLSRRISRPLEELKRGAQRFAAGELDLKLPVDGSSEELGSLAETLNRMAADLDDRISAVLRQKNEQTAVLASMVEGVVAVDSEQRLLNINQAAAGMFGVDPAGAGNRPISTVIDNRMLHDFILRILGGRQAIDAEIVLDEGQKILQCQGTPLLDAQGNFIGALAVFHDQTRLRKLEDLRREFVSNVSHELKTPITTIKGFVETLLDGDLDEQEDTRKFLGIISKHSDRLNAIIDDLLSLSRIEREEESAGIELEPGGVGEVLLAAVQACELKARDKNISLELTCDSELKARINPPLLEQAVVNLIGNAVKYSDPGGTVGIDAASVGQEVRIRVIDRGCGIPLAHHERIFERFYRVDKARSRNLGGTGLGLAIVKHIAVTHSGSVSVQSAPGKGSTFTLHLPVS
jgi:two-component system, OmpR family, phosphate regulon sensor histidine kinase PhoR